MALDPTSAPFTSAILSRLGNIDWQFVKPRTPIDAVMIGLPHIEYHCISGLGSTTPRSFDTRWIEQQSGIFTHFFQLYAHLFPR